MTTIRLENLSNAVLQRVNLTINKGELFVLLGPSGAGKSTLLQVIAGLLPCTGHIFFDDGCIGRLLERFGILALADRYPLQMSGGEKQRAALARAVATGPRILLLDEPFSSLDQENALRLRAELKAHQRHFRITTLFVTHNLAEARQLADRIGVIHQGRLTVGMESLTLDADEPVRSVAAPACGQDPYRAAPLCRSGRWPVVGAG